MRINLQAALDVGETDALLTLAEKLRPFVDWIEAGTPWILRDGMAPVHLLKSCFPEKRIVADMKIMDGGYYEACLGFRAGADLVTVLGAASDATIAGVVTAAREYNGQVMVDLLQVQDLTGRARRAVTLGADLIGLHTAYDDHSSGRSPLEELARFAGDSPAPVVVAGGLNLDNLAHVISYCPAAVVVGSALARAADPAQAAAAMRRVLDVGVA